MAGTSVQVHGLVELVRELKGPTFRDVNAALRLHARSIADDLAPHIRLAVRLSPAPQARGMSDTIRTKNDRLPVVVIGKVNPKFSTEKRFTRRTGNSARRRGAIAHGVIYGPKGGHPAGPGGVNFYRIGRDDSGGALGRSLKQGPMMQRASDAYLDAYTNVLRAHGFKVRI